MKKIISLLLVLLAGLMITGCAIPSAPEDDGPQFCVEKRVGIVATDVKYGDYGDYKSEYLRRTGCSNLDNCSAMIFINVCE